MAILKVARVSVVCWAAFFVYPSVYFPGFRSRCHRISIQVDSNVHRTCSIRGTGISGGDSAETAARNFVTNNSGLKTQCPGLLGSSRVRYIVA